MDHNYDVRRESFNIAIKFCLKIPTIKSLEVLGDTLHFIDFWLNLFRHSYEVRLKVYNKAMKKIQTNTNNEIKIT